jgi:DNA-binding XRE family transcriptional regulator
MGPGSYAIEHTLVQHEHSLNSATYRRYVVTLGNVSQVEGERDARVVALGRRLRAYREWRNLSQERLAERAGVDRPYISRIERGLVAMRVDLLMNLADVLGIDVRDLWADQVTLPREPD